MTDEELRVVKLLKTQSLPAFEHYARSLGFVDEGRYFDGLREARLARRADPAYFAAAARVAQLYYEVGEPEHAMIEYRRFVEEDRRDKLPAEVYLTMGKILEQAFADRAGAIAVVQRLVGGDPQFEQPFRITGPSPPFRSFNEAGGISAVNALFQEHKSALQALERIARWQLEAGEQLDAAQRYGQLWRFLDTHGMSNVYGHTIAFSGLQTKVQPEVRAALLADGEGEPRRDALSGRWLARAVGRGRGGRIGNQANPRTVAVPHLAGTARSGDRRGALLAGGRRHEDPGHLQRQGNDRFSLQGQSVFRDYPELRAAKRGGNLLQSSALKVMQVKPDGTWHTVKFEPGRPCHRDRCLLHEPMAD